MTDQMGKKPLVSVIIPVFNGAQYIGNALESVCRQTYTNFEIIVVDDGSTDGTKKMLQPWLARKNVHYVYQRNKGLARARNTGVKRSRGKYLKFLDCDDVLYPEQLERQVAHLENSPASMISVTDYELEFENGHKRCVNVSLSDPPLAQFIKGNPCPVHTILVPREFVENAGRFDPRLLSHEDSDLWIRILLHGGRFERIDYLGCCYKIREVGLSANTENMFRQKCKYLENLNRNLLKLLPSLETKIFEALRLTNILNIHICFAFDLNPSRYLPVTLRAIAMILRAKENSGASVSKGPKNWKPILKRRFDADCRRDPDNRVKLKQYSTLWRQERYYDDPNIVSLAMDQTPVRNILYFNTTSVVYGAETRLLDIIRTLDREKYRPFAVIPEFGPLEGRLNELGVQVMHLDARFEASRTPFSRFWKLNQDFIHLVREHQIDLIHVNLHLHFSNLWLAFLILRKPLVIHLRSHFYLHIFEKFIMCRAFKIICISNFTENAFLNKRRSSFFMGHRPGQTQVIYDGIDVNHFSPKETQKAVRKELGVRDDEFLVGIIGAIDKVKGQDIVIKAADQVIRRHPKVKFLIVGELYGTYESALNFRALLIRLIQDLDLEEHVIVHGYRGDIDKVMNDLDLLIQPSEREALGTSMVEAMSCGKPVIGTDIDGIPEVIGKNEGGMLLNPRTPDQLAKLIIQFVEQPELAARKGSQGRLRALQRFNVFKNSQKIQEIYHEALEDI